MSSLAAVVISDGLELSDFAMPAQHLWRFRALSSALVQCLLAGAAFGLSCTGFGPFTGQARQSSTDDGKRFC